jgi:hypothetical protein
MQHSRKSRRRRFQLVSLKVKPWMRGGYGR